MNAPPPSFSASALGSTGFAAVALTLAVGGGSGARPFQVVVGPPHSDVKVWERPASGLVEHGVLSTDASLPFGRLEVWRRR